MKSVVPYLGIASLCLLAFVIGSKPSPKLNSDDLLTKSGASKTVVAPIAKCNCKSYDSVTHQATYNQNQVPTPDLNDPDQLFWDEVEIGYERLDELNLPHEQLVIEANEKISWIAPDGKLWQWLFNDDGLVYERTIGSLSIRYTEPGTSLGGYWLKDPQAGVNDWVEVYRVNKDQNDLAISVTHVPSSQTIPMQQANHGNTPDAFAEMRPISYLVASQQSTKTERERCRQACRDARDDAAKTVRNAYKTCTKIADEHYQNCLIVGGLGSAVAGAGLGSLGGPVGAAIGAVAGFIAGEIACLVNGISELNACKIQRDGDLNNIRALFDDCISRCPR